MDVPESDAGKLLKEIKCPEQRARTAREWGKIDDDANAHLYCSGNGPQAQINAAILDDRTARSLPKTRKMRTVQRKRVKSAKRSAKQILFLASACPYCGRG